MGGKDSAVGNFAERVVKGQAIVLHALMNDLQGGKCTVPLIKVVDAYRKSECPQCLDATHAQHQFLANSGAVIAAIQAGC